MPKIDLAFSSHHPFRNISLLYKSGFCKLEKRHCNNAFSLNRRKVLDLGWYQIRRCMISFTKSAVPFINHHIVFQSRMSNQLYVACYTTVKINSSTIHKPFTTDLFYKSFTRMFTNKTWMQSVKKPSKDASSAVTVLFAITFIFVSYLISLTGRTICECGKCSDHATDIFSNGFHSSDDTSVYLSFTDNKQIELSHAINVTTDLCLKIKDEIGTPGLVVAVSKNGKNVFSSGFGYADVENRVPCTPDSVMRIASISKSITMAAVAREMDNGSLNIDKRVQEYVPVFPEKYIDGKKVLITTRHLLSHLGGIRHYSTSKSPASNRDPASSASAGVTEEVVRDRKLMADQSADSGQEEFYVTTKCDSVTASLDTFKDDPLVHEPGTKFLYTTHGWTLVSAVLEGATSRPFQDVMRQLFRDFRMHDTYLDDNRAIIYNRAKFVSYRKNLQEDKRHLLVVPVEFHLSEKRGASNIQAHLNTKDRSTEIRHGYLKPETMQMLWTPVDKTAISWDRDGSYGLGWGVVIRNDVIGCPARCTLVISHTGGAVGCSSVLVVVPDSREDRHSGAFSRPSGVVVVMIANIIDASLYRTAVKISELFSDVRMEGET